MAGGKLSPRQKMINLMYLVFIAMMAMQVSVEVITAFGLMNEKFESANKSAENTNQVLFDGLKLKAEDEPARYTEPYQKAEKVQALSNEFFAFVEELKADATTGFEVDPETGKYPYESMGKGAGIDYGWFDKDGYSARGNEIVARFEKYRNDFKDILGNDVKYKFLTDDIDAKFATNPVKNKDGQDIPFLEYHFKGFPAVSSLAYLSSIQNDVRQVEHEAYNLFLGNSLKQAASMKNYQAMVIPDKAVYYQGEQINYKVVLGRYDTSTVPTSVVVNGSSIPQSRIKMGQVEGSTVASGLGEHKFTGQFTFMEDGVAIPVKIENSNYVVVSRPSSATISADKMNVVYIGLDNPISITVEGITSDKISATTSNGHLRRIGNGKYILTPSAGKEAVITAVGTMPDGKAISSKQAFRIKAIPRPTGLVRGEPNPKGPINNLGQVTVSAKMEDFDFDVNLRVTQFTVVFPGIGSEVVNGTQLPASAVAKANRLRAGDVVRFTNIKVRLEGAPSSVIIRDPSDATFTIQ